MKRYLTILAVALSLGGCSTANIGAFLQNLADVEQQAVELITKIRAGAQVASDAVDRTINSVCVAIPGLNASVQSYMAAVPNPGPKSAQAIRTARISIDAASNACTAYVTAPQSASGRVTVLRNLWAAYQSAKQSIAAANAAAGG